MCLYVKVVNAKLRITRRISTHVRRQFRRSFGRGRAVLMHQNGKAKQWETGAFDQRALLRAPATVTRGRHCVSPTRGRVRTAHEPNSGLKIGCERASSRDEEEWASHTGERRELACILLALHAAARATSCRRVGQGYLGARRNSEDCVEKEHTQRRDSGRDNFGAIARVIRSQDLCLRVPCACFAPFCWPCLILFVLRMHARLFALFALRRAARPGMRACGRLRTACPSGAIRITLTRPPPALPHPQTI